MRSLPARMRNTYRRTRAHLPVKLRQHFLCLARFRRLLHACVFEVIFRFFVFLVVPWQLTERTNTPSDVDTLQSLPVHL